MYKSKEIRWFKDSSDKAILNWFAGHEQTFKNTSLRTDYYLPLNKEDVTVKLREGNIEIKQRIGEPVKGSVGPNAIGIFENWIKWSFNANKTDKLSQEIISHNLYNWIETVKITEDKSGNVQIVPIKAFVEFGCQIEYTMLMLSGKTIYTFGLEWFGEKEIQLPEKFMQEILNHTQLNLQDSMGYGVFLIN